MARRWIWTAWAATLHAESCTAAYLAVQVLVALGNSLAADQILGLRAYRPDVNQASQQEQAQEMVYFLQESSIAEVGTQVQVILAALSRVWALPGLETKFEGNVLMAKLTSV